VKPRTWGALFDWDGVIVDSSRFHEESWDRLSAETGKPLFPGHFRKTFGMINEEIIPRLLRWTDDPAEIRRLSRRKEELFRGIAREQGIAALPGAESWLRRLRGERVPCAVASSTQRENIEMILGLIGFDFFDAIVSSEDVVKGKPDPSVFLAAAMKIGRPPSRCVVFEDAHVGVAAARAAGMRVVGVATTHPADTLAGCDLVVRRLDEIPFESVEAWFRD
jgi:HAD superfamily hydrolase (TIGR01509 family)